MKTYLVSRCYIVMCLCLGMPPLAAGQSPVFEGVVRDQTSGQVLSGVSVTLQSSLAGIRTTRTDREGVFTFTSVDTGGYTLILRAVTYVQHVEEIRVGSPRSRRAFTMVRIAMLDTMRVLGVPKGIFGVVGTAHDLRPLPQSTVRLLGVTTAEATADSLGRFFFPLTKAGAYLVRGTASGRQARTVSVALEEHGVVEVAIILDSATNDNDVRLEAAYDDLRSRLIRRGRASVLISGMEMKDRGEGVFTSALLLALTTKSLRLSDRACVFIDGVPLPGYWPDERTSLDIAMLEAYAPAAEESGTLAAAWPPNARCGATGQPRIPIGPQSNRRGQPTDFAAWVVIWLKH